MQTLFLLAVCATPPPPVSTLERDLERLQIAPRHVPCEVRPRPAAAIEETDTPAGKPVKGLPDGRMMASAEQVEGKRDDVFTHFARKARDEGRPVGFKWTGNDGEVARFRANPDGRINILETNRDLQKAWTPPPDLMELINHRAVVATGPPPPPVIPGPGPVNYTAPAANARPMPARSVPAVQPFRSDPIPHEGHQCPACGTSQYVVAGRGPAPGTHTHRCPRCSTVWFH